MDPSSLDDVFRALAASHRRAICRYFESSGDDVAEFDDLVEFVVEEEGPARADDRSEHRREVAVDLYHVHLPRLSEAGLVEFDHRTGRVLYLGAPLARSVLAEIADGDVLRA